MTYAHNSTISLKKKCCKSCGKLTYIFSKGRCKDCTRIESSLAKKEETTKKIIAEENLQELIDVADDWFSKLVRLSHADENGYVTCYTCDVVMKWQQSQCGHYMKRGNLFLRFDQRNCRVQCKDCNEYKDGNLAEFTKRLEAEHPGITDILKEEAAVYYRISRSEVQGVIWEARMKIKELIKKIVA